MRKFLLTFLLSLPLLAQVPCGINATVTVTGTSVVIDNRSNQCYVWRLSYTTLGISGISVAVQSSPDNTTWTSYSGAAITDGANPNTTLSAGLIGIKATGAYVRLTYTLTGTGSLTYHLWGANSTSNVAAVSGGGGGGATIAHTQDLISGDGAGNGIDSLIPLLIETSSTTTSICLGPNVCSGNTGAEIFGYGDGALQGNTGSYAVVGIGHWRWRWKRW